ncbi:MAG: BrnA antitoxin family protein [Anaerolineae bacterium]|nr:BrnA antitoxin family protein [Anaerolineae bacterium]
MSKLPEFKTIAEEVAFWESHSTADYWDESEIVHFDVDVYHNLLGDDPTILLEKSDYCPRCQQSLVHVSLEYLTQNHGHLVSVRDVPAYQCDKGHIYMMAETFDLLLDLLEKENQQRIIPVEILHVPVFHLQQSF